MNTEELRRLHEAATPGPWAEFAESGDWWVEQAGDDGGPACDKDGEPFGNFVCTSDLIEVRGFGWKRQDDVNLMVAARNALPGLLDALDLARALVTSPLCPDIPEARALRAALGLPETAEPPAGWRL